MKDKARQLRREATAEERKLWYGFLRNFPLQFRRQAVFGPYIVDFYCGAARLVVELDGSQHYQGGGPAADQARTAWLEQRYGMKVLRFSNLDVKENFEGVCAVIRRETAARAKEFHPSRGKREL